MPCHSCGFQGLIITCYLATLVNRGLPIYHCGTWVFSCVSFVMSSCHEFLLYILVTTIEVVTSSWERIWERLLDRGKLWEPAQRVVIIAFVCALIDEHP